MGIDTILKIGGKALTQAKKAYVRPMCETVNGQSLLNRYLKSFNEQKLVSLENDIQTNIKNYYEKIWNMFILACRLGILAQQ